MSELAKTFASVMSMNRDNTANERVEFVKMATGANDQDAFLIQQALDRAIVGSVKAMGEALDGLPTATLTSMALPLILDQAPETVMGLNELVLRLVLLKEQPTPNCDCVACKQHIALNDELNKLRAALDAEARNA